MSTPSSTNTTAATGCIAATIQSTCSARCCTSGSGVKMRTSHGDVSATRMPTPIPTTMPTSIMRRAAARATAAVSAPRNFPTMACAAMAMASSANARNRFTCIAIWCAAMSSSPNRAAIAPATRNASSSDPVRTTSRLPTDGVAADPGGVGPSRRADPTDRARDHPHVRGRGAELREHRAPRRAREPEVEAVDEHDFEHDVHRRWRRPRSRGWCACPACRAGTRRRRGSGAAGERRRC